METLVLIGMLGAIALIMICYGTFHNKRQRAYRIKCIKDSYGTPCRRKYGDGEYVHIPGYHYNHLQNVDFNIDDITWNDLDMDRIYHEMNRTLSSAGDEYLYHLLRSPRLHADMRLEEVITYFMDHPDERLKLSVALSDMGRTGKYSIYDYINNLDVLNGRDVRKEYLLLILYVAAIAFMAISGSPVGGVVLALVLIYAGITYFSGKKKIEPYIVSFSYVFRLLSAAGQIRKCGNDGIKKEMDGLKEACDKMAGLGRFSGIVMSTPSSDPLQILMDYIKIFTHIDIIRFYGMRKQIMDHSKDIDLMLTIIGFLDASIAIGSYREYLGTYCVPDLTGDKYEATGLYHPLLSDPVANDVCLDRGMLLTGSNASGKSTMLKTIALSALLAQSVNTVPATSYKAPAYRIYTSLAVNDDIMQGDSYYMAEIKSLKLIVDEGKEEETPILACVDEVLRGTNTVERISASTVIMKQLSEVNGLILAATHDIELTDLLADCYDNYHFEELIEGRDIRFNYKLMPGKATSKNAIRLLSLTGYDEELVREASDMAKRYEETGVFSI